MKRKIFISITTVLYLSILIACQSSQNAKPNDIGNQIEKNLMSIMDNNSVLASSNPAAYIQDNQNLYDEILASGDKGLEFLLNELKNSKEDGLKEWIMAKACEDILKDERQIEGWSTGKEWLSKYESL
ncbi:hypothetical protein [Paenibacillus gallinarum]|uniref:Lipoprotein n=1 Tax=Paenibacillus gallinarum TaxID=2762232 RepID=A0ABR8T0L2_9BACL|nr:hypothetical protein [Paenibacillus gallinarum]MBD7969307.1 hypothetical protein [Paenibacillus gallinarum]